MMNDLYFVQCNLYFLATKDEAVVVCGVPTLTCNLRESIHSRLIINPLSIASSISLVLT